MGTRNLTCVISGGEHRIAQYGQWDGYPSGQGVNILDFLHTGNVAALKENAEKCVFITSDEYKEMWKEFDVDIEKQRFVSFEESNKFHDKYPQFNRDVASDILEMVASSENGLRLQDDYNFAADSLFCEWAYVIDFDKNTFEVYQGFNKTPLDTSDRFFGVVCGRDSDNKDDRYYPVKLVAMFDLSDLPTEEEFLLQLEPPETDEEEEDVG